MDSDKPDSISTAIDESGLRRTASNHVEWQKDHTQYPRNWSSYRKCYDATMIVFFEFYTLSSAPFLSHDMPLMECRTVISTTGPSAATAAMQEYHLTRGVALVAFVFMQVQSYRTWQAIGGLLVPPFSESFGRRKPYLYSCAAFSIGSLITGVVPSAAGVFVGRFMCGFASAAPSVVIAGSVQDLYAGTHRVWMILVWNSTTTLGLTIGPVYGAYLADTIGWRWIYYTSAMVTTVLLLLLFMIRESRSTKLLSQKIGELEKEYHEKLESRHNPDAVPNARALVELVLLRPARLVATEPIVVLVSLLSATSWGLVYLFTESLSVVYSLYGWSETTTSLAFIAIALGIPLSILPRMWEVRQSKQKKLRNQRTNPEDKIYGFVIAAPVLACSLWLFSWTIPPRAHTHWAVSMTGLVGIGFAANEFAYTLSGYLADSYTIYASSGLAGLAFFRALVSGLMPLFAYPMFSELGGNVAGSILAAVATVFCITPYVFLRYGGPLRERSRFARYSAEINEQYGDE
ncbi:uncharacterized protein EKO05_0001852 [Ascochyta rabiei]|nr:uncharacterized protein EKO05_0001852 [Ascochyta rabiei]UPX11234.1 hypothetical protein EKO05_0001852 [Ascochyta rabiei]